MALPKPTLQLFVSPSGNDSNDGLSADKPFRSITRARNAVRALKSGGSLPKGGVAVEIAGGDYPLTESLEFGPEDSGTGDAPVFYRASGKQPVVIHGSKVLKASDLAPVSAPQLLQRIDPAVRGKVLGASIDALGLKHAGPFPDQFDDSGGIFELFWNGKRLPLSRWPNEGWTTMKRAVVNGDAKIPGVFEYRDDRPSRWLLSRHLWLKGQWRVPWEEPAIRVAEIKTDTRTKIDPGFEDLANGDLTLGPDSEVFTKIPGFEPIPFDQIGLFKDACRTEIPTSQAIERPRGNPMFEQNPNKHFGTL